MSIEFARPEVLYALLLLPLWLVLTWPRRESAPFFNRTDRALVGGLRAFPPALVLLAPRLLRSASLAAIVLAIAGPHRVRTVSETSTGGSAIVLAIDLSTSMLAEDLGEASRLEIAKEAAARFASRRTEDELALIAFAGEAFTRVPPTRDHDLVVDGVRSLEVDQIRNGTDLSGAILTSLKRIADAESDPKVVVLLTDGAHNAAGVQPLATARAAASRGVRIHSIGLTPPEEAEGDIGSGSNAESILSAVSALTGGQYFRAEGAAALDAIYDRIDGIEAMRPRTVEREERLPARRWFLAVALGLIVLESLIRGSRWGVIP